MSMKADERRAQLLEIMCDLHRKAQSQVDFTAPKIANSAGISTVWFYKLVRPEFQALRAQLSGPRLLRDEELSRLRCEVADLRQKLQEAQHKLRTTAVEDLDEAILLIERYEKENIQLRQQVALLQKRLGEGGHVVIQPSHGLARSHLIIVNNDDTNPN
jgi:hypothetical protein